MLVERLIPYLGTGAVILIGTLLIFFSGKINVLRAPVVAVTSAPSTLAVVPSFTVPTVVLPAVEVKEEVVATSSPKPTVPLVPTPPKAKAPVVKKPSTPPSTQKSPTQSTHVSPTSLTAPLLPTLALPSPAPVSPIAAAILSSGSAALDTSAAALRAALVNIICYAPPTGTLHSITGSGVIIDPKGVIVTNAHVAQYFLLADKGVSCSIRTGGPAVDTYKASLMYISPAWLHANADVITQSNPVGTGQYDFALLAVTASAITAPLPASLPYVPLATEAPQLGTQVVIASYGAQYLQTIQILASLFPTLVFDSIRDVFTFGTNTIDIVELSGGAAAQEGSSGGGLADERGQLIGVLSTSMSTGDTSARSLHAITSSYIRAEYAEETGQSLDFTFSQSPTATAANFAWQIPALESIVTAHLR